ncbi:G-type lectin S-receptor-like serine/threonine-protein kinase At1g34300 [Neltuma alba]|uniref:G-type lectin S-receptor-like serine/threonine-protein kinase At1g34300 n=1 Tax=Neltuma alba TaxID=207710 RepID=UPI0010A4F94D|nr:G-type lectin S-receptor-like serine/threonine-protein kinase At1g34300 [Prosopis alba]
MNNKGTRLATSVIVNNTVKGNNNFNIVVNLPVLELGVPPPNSWPSRSPPQNHTHLHEPPLLQHKRVDMESLSFFLHKMEREKPIRFNSHVLMLATNNYSNMLGSGGFGSVYKGIFSDGTIVAVKFLNGSSDKRMEKQFMAEALVYEFMGNGSLDKYLFKENKRLGFKKLHEIAVGTAKGISYLHEECQQRIVHYDIKPENILLDDNFYPKVADFGLAKLCNRENTHITMTGGRRTPGYAAPELWMPFPITYKCDVYSFGMLLFEIIGRRRNLDVNLTEESKEWFPRWVWIKFDNGELNEMIRVCGIEEENKDMAERMVKIALWCVQYKPELRPMMSVVVKMLEGSEEIPEPVNPFQHFMDGSYSVESVQTTQTDTSFASGSSITASKPSTVNATPIMSKYESQIASSQD